MEKDGASNLNHNLNENGNHGTECLQSIETIYSSKISFRTKCNGPYAVIGVPVTRHDKLNSDEMISLFKELIKNYDCGFIDSSEISSNSQILMLINLLSIQLWQYVHTSLE